MFKSITGAHPKTKAAWAGEYTGAALGIVLAWVVNSVLGYELSIEVAMALGFLIVKTTGAAAKFILAWREHKHETG